MGKESLDKKQAKGIESKEGEKIQDSFIVCRENRLFKKWIPVVEETLSSFGSKVKVKSFPAETEPKEIGEWIKVNADKIKGNKFVRDSTSADALRGKIGEMYNEKKPPKEIQEIEDIKNAFDDIIRLDGLFAEATYMAAFGKNSDDIETESRKNIEGAGESLTLLIKKILENKENTPKQVYIFLLGILDHKPFNDQEKDEKFYHEAGDKVKEWLIKGGISADSIVVNPETKRENRFEVIDEINKADDSDNWIISDRHIGAYIRAKKDIKLAKDLELPVEDFYRDAQEQGLIEPDSEKMKEILTKLLKEEFTKEGEE